MGDPRRFDVMAEAVTRRWPDRSLRVADVAAGKGQLRAALYQRGYRDVVCFDRRPKRAHRAHYRYGLFQGDETEAFDLVLAMHPDGATDLAIAAAAKWSVPFAVVPCCVRPVAWPFNGGDYLDWVRHLERRARCLGAEVEQQHLRISGRGIMLVGRFP